jgi:thiamine transporter ThiT
MLSGVIFFSQGVDFMIWQGDLVGIAAWTYAFVYNILFLGPDTVIALVCAIILLRSRAFVSALENPRTRA